MTDRKRDIERLKSNAFEQVATSRLQLRGGMVDLSSVEDAVRAYCSALSEKNPEEWGPEHGVYLHELQEQMNLLEVDLRKARDAIQEKLASLNQHNKANSAYKKTDNIGTKLPYPKDDEEGGL